jgi:hypothetical protein
MKVRSNKVKDIWTSVRNLHKKFLSQMNKNSAILNRQFHNLVIKQVYSRLEAQSDLLLVHHLVLEVLERVNMVKGLFGRQGSQHKEENHEGQIEIMIAPLLAKVLGLRLN